MNTFLFEEKTGKQIFWSFVLTNAVYLSMILYTIPYLHTITDGLEILDLRTNYSKKDVFELFSILQESWQSYYVFPQLFLDSLYPALFVICYTWIIIKLQKQIWIKNKWLKIFAIFPLITAFSDYFENICIFIMLKTYPEITNLIVNFWSSFSLAKYIFWMMSFGIILILLVVWSLKKLKERKV